MTPAERRLVAALPEVVAVLIESLDSRDRQVRREAAEALARFFRWQRPGPRRRPGRPNLKLVRPF
jgi:hypothetical protein